MTGRTTRARFFDSISTARSPLTIPPINGVRSHVFSYGHRNPLGLVVGPKGEIYESEHGPNTDDEVNLIEGGRNYGWPNVAGYRDGKTYVYANWSASKPTPCPTLPAGNAIPASVPTQTEMSWNNPRFAPPLRTFFTIDTGTYVPGIGSATMAPGGIDIYIGTAIPGWRNSLLALSLIRGVVYRLKLSPDGTFRGRRAESSSFQPRIATGTLPEPGRADVLSRDGS